MRFEGGTQIWRLQIDNSSNVWSKVRLLKSMFYANKSRWRDIPPWVCQLFQNQNQNRPYAGCPGLSLVIYLQLTAINSLE